MDGKGMPQNGPQSKSMSRQMFSSMGKAFKEALTPRGSRPRQSPAEMVGDSVSICSFPHGFFGFVSLSFADCMLSLSL